MTHLIFTRFLCTPIGFTNEQLLSDNLFENRLKLFINNELPSLNNQTNTNFELVTLIHKDLDLTRINKIKHAGINMNFKHTIIKFDDCMQYIKDNYPNDKLLITKMDDDDFIYSNAVTETQKLAMNINGICIAGYTFGYIYNEHSDIIYEYSNTYNGYGHINIFQTLIVNCSNVQYSKMIYPYAYQHVDTRPYFSYFHTNNIATDCIQFKTPKSFIYVRHNNNLSKNGINDYKKYLGQSFKINDISRNLNNRFGFNKI